MPRLTYLPDQTLAATALRQRVYHYFGTLDSLDADAIASCFTPDATVSLPGVAPIAGRAAIRKALVQFSLDVDDLHHQPVQIFAAGNLSVFEGDITLSLADQTTLTFPVTHILRWVGGLIEQASVNVYLESRLAVALSAFDRTRAGYAEAPSHKSIGFRTPCGRNGSSILRPWPAEA
jgi:ketosteroid isomerase-like protein